MIVPAGNTAHFNVSYDDSLSYAQTLANDVLSRCEADLATLAGIWSGTPVAASFQVTIVNGGGGGAHTGTDITLHANSNQDAPGVSALLVAEVDEVFMSQQIAVLGKGFNRPRTGGLPCRPSLQGRGEPAARRRGGRSRHVADASGPATRRRGPSRCAVDVTFDMNVREAQHLSALTVPAREMA